MASVNKVILVGNVGRDPEIRYTQGGDPIANFSIATNEAWTDKSGQKQEHTEWHNVEVFGKTAQVVRDYVSKGRQVYIEGSIRTNEYKDKDGNPRKSVRVRVSAQQPARRAVAARPRPTTSSRRMTTSRSSNAA